MARCARHTGGSRPRTPNARRPAAAAQSAALHGRPHRAPGHLRQARHPAAEVNEMRAEPASAGPVPGGFAPSGLTPHPSRLSGLPRLLAGFPRTSAVWPGGTPVCALVCPFSTRRPCGGRPPVARAPSQLCRRPGAPPSIIPWGVKAKASGGHAASLDPPWGALGSAASLPTGPLAQRPRGQYDPKEPYSHRA